MESYLDYAAATPMAPEVAEAMLPYLGERFWNPSAPYALARSAKADLEDARVRLAHALGARADNLVITAGATEANNLALASSQGAILTDSIEHESVLACARSREHRILGVQADGRLRAEDVASALDASVGLVSLELANGEVGAIQPVREVSRAVCDERARRLREGEGRPIWLHVDASQAAGLLSVNVSSLGADLLTLSAAKIYGPKQVGLLWAADGVVLRPLVLGGGQEGGVRSGTENVAGAVAFACALELAQKLRKEEAARLSGLRNRLQVRLLGRFPWAWVAGPSKDKWRLPSLLHVSFPLLEARRLVILLERRGVSVGTGSACAASRMRVSHVLAALGVPEEVAMGSLRITLGRPSTQEELDFAAEALEDAVSGEMARLGLTEVRMAAESARLRREGGAR